MNSVSVIKRAIESVLSQDYLSWEYIVIDGGSTDGTIKILESYPQIKFISEPDGGQADAMNKGIDLATGDIIGFLNADDYYYPGAFSHVVKAFDDKTSVVVGNVFVRSIRMKYEFLNEPRTTLEGMMRHWEPNAFCYNPVGYFCRIDLQKRCRFNPNNYASMDLEFLLAAAAEENFKKIDVTLGCFEDSFDTKTDKTQLMPDYWRASTFPYIDKYLDKLENSKRIQFENDRREGYAAQQANTNSQAQQRGKKLPSPEETIKVSVIIPVHNDMHLACNAIDSVINQTYKNIEIIIVDDASNENAANFLKNKFPHYYGLKVHRHLENKMLGGARNTGIGLATGDYIYFLDADDHLFPNSIERLVTIAVACNVDVVQGGSKVQDENGRVSHFHSAEFASDGGLDGLNLFSKHQFASIAWNKLYNARFLKKEDGPRFIEKFAHEDVVFSAKVAFFARGIVSISDPVITYKFNLDSITRKPPTRKNIESYIYLYIDLVENLSKFGVMSSKHRELLKNIIQSHIVSDLGPKLIRCSEQMSYSVFSDVIYDSCWEAFGGHGISLAGIIAFFVGSLETSRGEVRLLQENLDSIPISSPHFAEARPRILVDGIFWQYNNTGIARVWENLLKEWVKSGFAGNIIVLDRMDTAPRVPGVQYWSIAKHDYAHTGSTSLELEEICKQLGADLFVSTYYTIPTSTPSLFVGYDMIPEVYGFDLAQPMWQEKRKAILHAAAHSMISESSVNDLIRYYPEIGPNKTYTSYPGVASEFMRAPLKDIESFRTKFDLSDRPYILFVGNRTEYKNGILAFKALAELPKDIRWILICVGGYAEIEPDLRDIALELDVRRLKLTDDELIAAYSGAHCLLYPSKYEGFGLPPLEAMSCGTPAIVCHNSSIPEAVGDAAVFVDDTDPKEAAAAILSLFDADIRERLITKGYAQAAKFSFANMAHEMQNALIETCCRLQSGEIARPSSIWSELRSTEKSLQYGLSQAYKIIPSTTHSNFLSPDDIEEYDKVRYIIDFSLPYFPHFIKEARGLGDSEGWGRWTEGSEVFLRFPNPLPKNFTLEIHGRSFEGNDQQPINIIVGSFTTSLKMSCTWKEEPYYVEICNDDHADCIIFDIPHAQSPARFTSGVQSDQRELGLALTKLSLINRADEYRMLTSSTIEVPMTDMFLRHALNWEIATNCHIDFTGSSLPPFIKAVRGLSAPESWARWTVGPMFSLQFSVPLPSKFLLEIRAQPYISNVNKPIVIAVGGFSKSFKMIHELEDQPYRIEMFNPDNADSIIFYIPDPQSPFVTTSGTSSDQRELGIALFSLDLIKIDENYLPSTPTTDQDYKAHMNIPDESLWKSSNCRIDFKAESLPYIIKDFHGLDVSEGWGRWTLGPEFSLSFRTSLPRKFDLIIKGHSYGTNYEHPITVVVGNFSSTFMMNSTLRDEPYKITVVNESLDESIKFYVPNPQSPLSVTSGVSNDPRVLGFAVVSIDLIKTD